MQINTTTGTWHFPSTVHKRTADGTECLSDHVAPNETLLDDAGRHADDRPSVGETPATPTET